MSTLLATAANLATDVAAWMARADMTGDIPTMIVLFEAKVNRLLRTLGRETTSTAFVLAGEYTPLPADFLEFKSGYINGSPRTPLQYLPGDSMAIIGTDSSAQYFTIVGNNFRFAPIPDGGDTATITYSVKLPTLSGVGVQTNWLLAQHPDAYLYGTLLEANGKIADDQAVAKWQSAVTEVFNQIKSEDGRKRYGGNAMQVRCA